MLNKSGLLALFWILTCGVSYGQGIEVKELHIQGVGRDSLWEYDFKFPLVVCAKKQVQDIINYKLVSDCAYDEGLSVVDSNSIRAALSSSGADFLVNFEYSVLISNQHLFEIDISTEGLGAYPTYGLAHYLFDLKTGKRYNLTDITCKEKLDVFSSMVSAVYKDSLNAHILELINETIEMTGDTSGMDDIFQYLNDCIREVDERSILNTYNFYFDESGLFIESACGLPRYARVYEPYFKLYYPYHYLKEYLRPEIYQQLISNRGKK